MPTQLPPSIQVDNKLVYKVTNSKIDYANNVRRIWGVEWAQRDIVYRWSNGRIFRDSANQGGPYGPQT